MRTALCSYLPLMSNTVKKLGIEVAGGPKIKESLHKRAYTVALVSQGSESSSASRQQSTTQQANLKRKHPEPSSQQQPEHDGDV